HDLVIPVPTVLQRSVAIAPSLPRVASSAQCGHGADHGGPVVAALRSVGAVGVGAEADGVAAAGGEAGRDVPGVVADHDRAVDVEAELAGGVDEQAGRGLA